MAVLFYQIGIFLIIQISSLFGNSARNTAIGLISLFTLFQVFTSWLLALQFITIYISYEISKGLISKNSKSKNSYEPNYVTYSFRENGGRSVTMVDLNDKNLDGKIRKRAELQNQVKEDSNRRYEEDAEYKSSIDAVINKMMSGSAKTFSYKSEEINLDTKFYYIKRSKKHGPITAKRLIHLVETNQLSKNCFVREESNNTFDKRAIEIIELLQ
ncbi:hypothetical protein [Christiangramia sp.]|uniref:hypothetical protein n=1 Tax=Christiangramia sp. TaxID=1931228 RepID=UPI00260B259C|nr:hypothetical protein [Christiangramia sp.]